MSAVVSEKVSTHLTHFQRVTNIEVLRRTYQTQPYTVLCDRRLRLFGHVARSVRDDAPFASTVRS